MPHSSAPSEEDRNFDPAWLDPNQIPPLSESLNFNHEYKVLGWQPLPPVMRGNSSEANA